MRTSLFLLCLIVKTGTAQIKTADSLFFAQDFKAARKVYEKNKTAVDASPLLTNRVAYCYHKTGNLKAAIGLYLKAEATATTPVLKYTIESRLARVYAVQHNNAESISWLRTAVKNGYSNIKELDEEPDFAGLRTDKHFVLIRDSVFNVRNPCYNTPQNREFDFWIGEWTVTASGLPVGHSLIQKASGGCMILENWTASDGSNGKSMNYIDPATGKWEQTWSGSGGDLSKFVNGVYDGKQMLFEFEKTVNGAKLIGRFHFFNLGPNQVRQMNETSADNGKTWNTVYDLLYTRIK